MDEGEEKEIGKKNDEKLEKEFLKNEPAAQ